VHSIVVVVGGGIRGGTYPPLAVVSREPVLREGEAVHAASDFSIRVEGAGSAADTQAVSIEGIVLGQVGLLWDYVLVLSLIKLRTRSIHDLSVIYNIPLLCWVVDRCLVSYCTTSSSLIN
jgi:hypothetical protein